MLLKHQRTVILVTQKTNLVHHSDYVNVLLVKSVVAKHNVFFSSFLFAAFLRIYDDFSVIPFIAFCTSHQKFTISVQGIIFVVVSWLFVTLNVLVCFFLFFRFIFRSS